MHVGASFAPCERHTMARHSQTPHSTSQEPSRIPEQFPKPDYTTYHTQHSAQKHRSQRRPKDRHRQHSRRLMQAAELGGAVLASQRPDSFFPTLRDSFFPLFCETSSKTGWPVLNWFIAKIIRRGITHRSKYKIKEYVHAWSTPVSV